MFNAFFNDMAVNQQQMEVSNKKESKLRDNARKLLEKAYTKLGVVSQNKVAEADAPAKPVPTTITSIRRLLAGLTKLI